MKLHLENIIVIENNEFSDPVCALRNSDVQM